MERTIECDYCWRHTDDTKKCFIKDGNHPRAPWSKRESNVCASCRKHLHGLFKYVK